MTKIYKFLALLELTFYQGKKCGISRQTDLIIELQVINSVITMIQSGIRAGISPELGETDV